MSVERHSDSDGSDIFWPGYVDAVTNLVLNLLFLLTIMTVAVFMFALELGRASQGGPAEAVATAKEKVIADPVAENIVLKREIQRLNKLLASQEGGVTKTVEVTSTLPEPQHGLGSTLASDSEILVRFTDAAVSFTPEEHDRLLESLQPISASGNASIYVEVPPGFSEAKRLGFYRAMAVRNVLLEMQLASSNIDVAVVEGKNQANAALVRVKPR